MEIKYNVQDIRYYDAKDNNDMTDLVLTIDGRKCVIPMLRTEVEVLDINNLIERECFNERRRTTEEK